MIPGGHPETGCPAKIRTLLPNLVRVQIILLFGIESGCPADMEQECQDQISRYALSEAPGHLIRRCQQRAVDLFAEEVG